MKKKIFIYPQFKLKTLTFLVIFIVDNTRNMIHIPNKYDRVLVSIPRNEDNSGRFDFLLRSELTHKEYEYEVTDEGTSVNYYQFYVDFWKVDDGEYRYFLSQDDELVAEGLAQIGDIADSTPIYVFYNWYNEGENVQYVPLKKKLEVRVPDSLQYDSTELEFTIYSNVDWVYTIYRNGTQYGSTKHGTKGKNKQYIEIPTNPTKELVVWHIACGDEEGDISVSKDVWQFGIPLSVSITSPSPTIASDATEIPFTITYDEWQTTRVGTIYLYKDGEQEQTMPLNYYPLTFSSAFTISPNLTYSKINYDLKVVVDATPNQPMISAATRVIQDEANYLIMSANSYTLAATDTSLSWSYSANTNWTLTATSPWGTGVSQKTAGSDTPIFYFEKNNTLSARTFTYIGENADSEVTLTFVQAASAVTPTPTGYTTQRFTIEMIDDGDLTWEGVTMYYAKNGDEGYQLDHQILGLEAGDVIEFYAVTDGGTKESGTGLVGALDSCPITSSARHIVYGNIMSLYYRDFVNAPTLGEDDLRFGFRKLFAEDTGLVSAENLVMPSSLSTGMCSSMFRKCRNLTTAPALPARVLPRYVYDGMFQYCSNLNYIKCLAEELPGTGGMSQWVLSVQTNSGTFVKSANATFWASGTSGIPENWDAIDE